MDIYRTPMDTSEQKTSFTIKGIVEWLLPRLTKRLQDMFKPFVGIFNEVPTYTVSEPYTLGTRRDKYVDVNITLPGKLQLPGNNELVAIIDNMSATYKMVNGYRDVPKEKLQPYFNCDHCGKNRNRTFNFLLKDEHGQYKCVGSSCVKSYLGVDPERVLRAMNLFMTLGSDINSIADEYGEDPLNGAGKRISWKNMLVDTSKLINFIYDFIQTNGYEKKEYDKDGYGRLILKNITTNTADAIGRELEMMVDHPEELDKISDDPSTKEALIAFYANQHFNEIVDKFTSAVKHQEVEFFNIGLFASMIARFLEGKANQNVEFYGNVGEKIANIPVEVISHIGKEGQFGMFYIIGMKSGNNLFVYKGGSPPKDMNKGVKGLLSGSIKAHDTYGGIKQTVVQRVKFQPTLSERERLMELAGIKKK